MLWSQKSDRVGSLSAIWNVEELETLRNGSTSPVDGAQHVSGLAGLHHEGIEGVDMKISLLHQVLSKL